MYQDAACPESHALTNTRLVQGQHFDPYDLLLADALSHLLHNGVPAACCQGVIHLIFKADSRDNTSKYRGRIFTPTLSKLYAMVLAGRLTDWAEQGGLRAIGISGFRREFDTVDDISILQTLLKQTRNRRQKYYRFVPG